MCEPVTLGICAVCCCCVCVVVIIAMFYVASKLMPLLQAFVEIITCANETVHSQLQQATESSDSLAKSGCVQKVLDNFDTCSTAGDSTSSELPQQCKDINEECGCKITEQITKLSNWEEGYSDCCDFLKENDVGIPEFGVSAEDIHGLCVEAMENITKHVDESSKACANGQDPFADSNSFMFALPDPNTAASQPHGSNIQAKFAMGHVIGRLGHGGQASHADASRSLVAGGVVLVLTAIIVGRVFKSRRVSNAIVEAPMLVRGEVVPQE